MKQFRISLDNARTATPPSPAASALYARILARLGEPQQAMEALGSALEQNPHDPDLRVALGHVRFEEGDYPAAYAQAQAVLKRDPADKRALSLKLAAQGRSKGAATGASPLPASGLEEASILADPRIVAAGRRALARQSAIGYADEALRRLNIRDPQEALRYLGLAEAVDPGYADVPMQQGIAHKALRQHAAAVERFTRAEALWSMKNTPDAANVVAMARQWREEEAAALTMTQTPTLIAEVPKPPKREIPLWHVGAALITVGLGALVILDKRRQEDQARKFIEVAGPLGVAGIGAGFIAVSPFPPAGFVAGPIGVATLTEVPALVRAALGVSAAVGTVAAAKSGSELISYAQSEQVGNEVAAPSTPENQGVSSSIKGPAARDPKLKNIINDMFKPGDRLPGGTAGAVRNEIMTGQKTGARFHLKKAGDYIRALDDVLANRSLDPVDRATALAMRQDLLNALDTKPVIVP